MMTPSALIDLKERIAISDVFTPSERDWLLTAVNALADAETTGNIISHLDPGTYLGRIDHLWAFLTSDHNGEGVAAIPMGDLPCVPMIAADMDRVNSLKRLAHRVAAAFGKPVRLVKFTKREHIEIYQP